MPQESGAAASTYSTFPPGSPPQGDTAIAYATAPLSPHLDALGKGVLASSMVNESDNSTNIFDSQGDRTFGTQSSYEAASEVMQNATGVNRSGTDEFIPGDHGKASHFVPGLKKIQSSPYLSSSSNSAADGPTTTADGKKTPLGSESVDDVLADLDNTNLSATDADVQGYGTPENYSNWRKWYVSK